MTPTGSTQIDAAFAVDFAERARVAMVARDVDALVDLATDDVIYDDMGADKSMEGKTEMARFVGSIYGAAVDLDVHVEGVFVGVDGETMAIRWRAIGRRADLDIPFELEFVNIYTIRDGKACRWTTIFRHMDWLGHIWP